MDNKAIQDIVKSFLQKYLKKLEMDVSVVLDQLFKKFRQEVLLLVKQSALPGKDGAAGAKGDKGDQGDTGESIVGAQGLKGDKGDKGDTGATGSAGIGLQGPKGDKGDAGKNGMDIKAEEIRDKLKSLRGSNRLPAEAIDGLIDLITEYFPKQLGGGGGQGSWKIFDLSGTINGSNAAFTYIGQLPALNSETVYLNNSPQRHANSGKPDYSISVSGAVVTITYVTDSIPGADLANKPHYIVFQ